MRGLQIIYLIGAFQGFLLVLLLLTRKPNKSANFYLALLIASFSVQGLITGYSDQIFELAHPHLSRIGWVISSVFAPCLYLYVLKLTNPRPRLQKKDLLYFLPTLAYILYLAPYFLLPADEKRQILLVNVTGEPFYFDELKLMLAGLYTFAALKHLKVHQKSILNQYSAIEQKRLTWLKQFIYFFIVLWFTAFIAVNISLLQVKFPVEPVAFLYIAAVAGIYGLGYKGLGQPWIFGLPLPTDYPSAPLPALTTVTLAPKVPELMSESIAMPAKYKGSSLSEKQSAAYLQNLLVYMDEKKPYLQNEITLQDLAEKIQMPHHQLSQVINHHLKKNFYEFINAYRVEEAKQLLLSPKHKHFTNLAIAYEAGFNSKTTFNTTFKKITGLTPSEYISSLKG